MAKKIGAIVSLTIIGILIIATIVMANININYGVPCSSPADIHVEYSGTSIHPDNAEREKIASYINTASNEKVLNAIFNGNLGEHAKVTTHRGTLSSSSSAYYVRYSYNSSQTLKENGSKFVDGDNKSYTFEEIVFVITEAEGVSEFKAYVIPDDSNNAKYSHYYTFNADFEDLYDYLKEIK